MLVWEGRIQLKDVDLQTRRIIEEVFRIQQLIRPRQKKDEAYRTTAVKSYDRT